MLARAVALAAALVLAGCGARQDEEPRRRTPVRPAPIPAAALMLRFGDPDLQFRWTMVPEAVLEPLFFNSLSAEARDALRSARSEATAAHATAAKSGYPFHAYAYRQRWHLAAETAALLALWSEVYLFTGGAHGNSTYTTALWDRAARVRIDPYDLFTDRAAAAAVLEKDWCRALREEQARRRAGNPMPGFDDCPPLAEQMLLPTGEGRISGFLVLSAPYAAGPYVEGGYEIRIDALPVVPWVKPVYRNAFG
jgi:hypothetical protein